MTADSSSPPNGYPLNDALNRLWTKFLPQMQERVSTLRLAAAKVAGGDLSPDEQQKAFADAHKLAGVLGTFGLREGTDLAREAEALYGGTLELKDMASARLAEIAEQLRTMIESRG